MSRWETPSASAAPATKRARIESIDIVRGIIMIIMALDHTRDYFGIPGQSPTNLATASAALFFTRWITNICAPVFFLLTGTGAFLSLRRRTASNLSGFLVTRGLWLIVLDVVVLRCLAYQFNFDFRVTLLIVLWALGWAMISLGALVRLPPWAVTTMGF
ncbi:MAG TPA: heparan-alpha-glucosaminide N-acetyltransferase domain-containing protein, partial [Gemmatimonadaceae bacterium]|nr:heparan-alpha-glucosaminide N-acetyltransferase domain-containing protein [Gemmatimonadaceae bacterium]